MYRMTHASNNLKDGSVNERTRGGIACHIVHETAKTMFKGHSLLMKLMDGTTTYEKKKITD